MSINHDSIVLTEFQKQVCLGTLLGDSSLSRPKSGRNFHLSCYHSEKQIEWLKQKHRWLDPVVRPIQTCSYMDKRDGKTRSGARFHTISASCFTEFAAVLYRDGRKIIPKSYVKMITHPVALACLVCDDGSWDKAGIQIATKQFSKMDNEILAERLSELFDIDVDIYSQGYFFLRIPARSVEAVTDICLPYVPEFLLYKFGGGSFRATVWDGKQEVVCGECGSTFWAYKSENRKFCGRKCSARGRLQGYQTRSKVDACPMCGEKFLRYSKRQRVCAGCR